AGANAIADDPPSLSGRAGRLDGRPVPAAVAGMGQRTLHPGRRSPAGGAIAGACCTDAVAAPVAGLPSPSPVLAATRRTRAAARQLGAESLAASATGGALAPPAPSGSLVFPDP